MPSNYPPGITGREFEISGPDHEVEEERACTSCGVTALTTVYTYGWQRWFFCDACEAENNLSDEMGPDPDLHAHERTVRYHRPSRSPCPCHGE